MKYAKGGVLPGKVDYEPEIGERIIPLKQILVCYGNADDFYHNMAVAEYVGRWEVMDDYAPLGDPIAWQPLPKPYKGGDTE